MTALCASLSRHLLYREGVFLFCIGKNAELKPITKAEYEELRWGEAPTGNLLTKDTVELVFRSFVIFQSSVNNMGLRIDELPLALNADLAFRVKIELNLMLLKTNPDES